MPKHKPDADREVFKTLRRMAEPDTVLFVTETGVATMRTYPDGPRVTRLVSTPETRRLIADGLVKPVGVSERSGSFVLSPTGRSRLQGFLAAETRRRRELA